MLIICQRPLCSSRVNSDSVLTTSLRMPSLAISCATMSAIQDATDAASISEGLVHGSLPVLEPNEYRAFDIMPLVVETDPSPAAGLPFQIATALRIIATSWCLALLIASGVTSKQ